MTSTARGSLATSDAWLVSDLQRLATFRYTCNASQNVLLPVWHTTQCRRSMLIQTLRQERYAKAGCRYAIDMSSASSVRMVREPWCGQVLIHL